jgi:transposase
VKILRTHKIRRITADEIQQVLRGEPLSVTPGTSEAVAEHVCTLLPLLQAFHEQRKHVNDALKKLTEDALEHPEEPEHKTVSLLRSLPGVGLDISTTLLSEAGRVLADADGAAFRCYAGVAPVTKQSGKSRRVVMRYGCNHRVRDACYHWARTSVQRDVISRSHYKRLRNAGHCHGRALRGVCDRLISVLMAMLRSRTPYNAEIRLAFRTQEAAVQAG